MPNAPQTSPSQSMMSDNNMLTSPQPGSQQQVSSTYQYNASYVTAPQSSLQHQSFDFMTPQQQQAMNQQMMATTMQQEPRQQYMPYNSTSMDGTGPLHALTDMSNGLVGFPFRPQEQHQQHAGFHQQPPFGPGGILDGSSENQLDMQSQSGSENGWVNIHMDDVSLPRSSFESNGDMFPPNVVHNPHETLQLHLRTDSHSSNDAHCGSAASTYSSTSWDEVQYPMGSPTSDTGLDLAVHRSQPQPIRSQRAQQSSPTEQSYSSSPSSSSSPTSPTSGSPTQRRKKEPASKPVAKGGVKKTTSSTTTIKKGVNDKEKRVGRRKGPLRPDQRAQAGEIRKLRACLRCKFLKKTCDKNDPCAGCQPAHARLWQVPCTRIDIKEIGYFLKDWKADYERHVTLGFSIANIRGYSPLEQPIFITHGFGFVLPIQAREVFVRDESCFNVDWVESNKEVPTEYESPTARLTAGIDGVSTHLLSEYLDQHITPDAFEFWVDKHFEGTVFLTEMLKTAFNYYQSTKLPIIHKALKLIVAYNLTLHVTMVEGHDHDEHEMAGKIDDNTSKICGQTLAPVMINFQIKHALGMMWRELQKDVLEELSALYSSVYNGERLRNWPTIFMLATILLAVWEEIQFDSHYRMPDSETVKKFCNEMESTPVGVIVGLFGAISQKLPAFQEWDTEKHQHLLHSNQAICDAMTEVRGHVEKYEEYLKARSTEAKFDRNNFDSLSNKFLSKLVIRAN